MRSTGGLVCRTHLEEHFHCLQFISASILREILEIKDDLKTLSFIHKHSHCQDNSLKHVDLIC